MNTNDYKQQQEVPQTATGGTAMLKIGEFSKLSRVSVRMLRHYDEIGLLKPAEIDRFTDYRYYREDQLPIAGRIAALKDIVLPRFLS